MNEPNPAYNFGDIRVTITPDHVKDYFMETPAAVSALLDHLIVTAPYTLSVFLDEHRDDFEDFVLTRVGGA